MYKHYLASALRHFARHKTTTVINVICLALGLTCFVVAYGLTQYYSNGDLYHEKADRTYIVTQRIDSVGQSETPLTTPISGWSVAPLLRQDYPTLEVARAVQAQEMAVAAPDAKQFAWVAYADPAFLHIFDLNFVAGNRRTALEAANSVIVSEEFAQKFFGRTDVIGKSLLLNNRATVYITGVIGPQPEPSHIRTSGQMPLFRFTLLASMDVYDVMRAAVRPAATLREQLFYRNTLTYVAFPDHSNVTTEQIRNELTRFGERHVPADMGRITLDLHPISKFNEIVGDLLVQREKRGISNNAMTLLFGSLVLLAACLSYANLASAQASTRLKELAMRRVIGASHRQILVQSFYEALILVVAAACIALALLPGMIDGVRKGLGMDIGSVLFGSPSFWIWMIVTIVAVALLACSYPAWVTARVRPAQALQSGRAPLTKRRAMRALVVCQFAMASFLFILTMVMSAQNEKLRPAPRGVTNDPIVVISNNLQEAGVDLQLLQNELRRESTVKAVGATDLMAGQIGGVTRETVLSGAESTARRWMINTVNVDYDYFSALESKLLAGRTFDRSVADDVATARGIGSVVIDRALAADYGWVDPRDAIGKSIFVAGSGAQDAVGLPRIVVGVVENQMLVPLVFVGKHSTLYSLDPTRLTRLVVRISRYDVAGGLAAIDKTWNRLAPNFPLKRQFFDEQFDSAYKTTTGILSMFPVLALLSMLVGTMGLVGIATHAIAQRRFEIGVRRTLGAGVRQVLLMLLRDFSKPILIANLIVWPFAFVIAKAYTGFFADRAQVTIVPFVASLLLGLAIAWLAVLRQATNAARLNPATVLRYE